MTVVLCCFWLVNRIRNAELEQWTGNWRWSGIRSLLCLCCEINPVQDLDLRIWKRQVKCVFHMKLNNGVHWRDVKMSVGFVTRWKTRETLDVCLDPCRRGYCERAALSPIHPLERVISYEKETTPWTEVNERRGCLTLLKMMQWIRTQLSEAVKYSWNYDFELEKVGPDLSCFCMETLWLSLVWPFIDACGFYGVMFAVFMCGGS